MAPTEWRMPTGLVVSVPEHPKNETLLYPEELTKRLLLLLVFNILLLYACSARAPSKAHIARQQRGHPRCSAASTAGHLSREAVDGVGRQVHAAGRGHRVWCARLIATHPRGHRSGPNKAPQGTSRGTLLTVLGARSTRPAVATVSGAQVRSAAASAASASSAAARPASFLRGNRD